MKELKTLGVIRIITWSIVAVFMIIIFSRESTIAMWGDNQTKTLLLAVLIAFGLGADLVIRIIIKRKGIENDNNYKAINIGLITTLLYVFIITIIFYTKFEELGVVPVGWLWFIAYSTIVFVNITFGVCDLLFNQRR